MRQRIESTETGWLVAKAGVLVVVLATLSGFTVLSHIVSHASAGRIDCSDNQRLTSQTLLMYQADHDGANPPSMDALPGESQDHPSMLGRCPADPTLRYYIGASSGRVFCPNPEHRSGS